MPSTKPAAKTAARHDNADGNSVSRFYQAPQLRNNNSKEPFQDNKTSRASSTPAAMPSVISWAHWPEKAVRSNRQGKNGRTLVVCLDPGAASPGACSTLNISVSPNAASACFLWQVVILISIPQKYFLSARACAGILVRASRRGKTLPALLDLALRQQADMRD